MPVHFQAITNNSEGSSLLASLLQGGLDAADGAIASEDGRILHIMRVMRDLGSGERIGKIVYTYLKNDERKSLETLDIDITLDSVESVELEFLNMLPESSDADEYYDVEAVAEGQHLQIETVNRNFIKQDILNTVQRVRTSAFPFRLTVYDDLDALNDAFGFKPVKAKGTDMTVSGFAPTFAAPSSIVQNEDYEGETFSFLIGTVKSFRDVSVVFGDCTLPFVIAQVESALGLLPTAMGRDVFDLSRLAPGKIVAMYADIKADFAVDQ